MMWILFAALLYTLGMYQEATNIQILGAVAGEEIDPFWKGLLLLGWPAFELYKLVLDVIDKGDDNE